MYQFYHAQINSRHIHLVLQTRQGNDSTLTNDDEMVVDEHEALLDRHIIAPVVILAELNPMCTQVIKNPVSFKEKKLATSYTAFFIRRMTNSLSLQNLLLCRKTRVQRP